jgi:hypothetical protein
MMIQWHNSRIGGIMKSWHYIVLIAAAFSLTACVNESAMPLGNHMMQIDVSAAPVYGRAGAQRIAMENAAKATLQAGYDKFIVLGNNDWNETTIAGGSHGSVSGSFNNTSGYISGSQSSGFSSLRNPESKLVIRMYKNGEKDADSAVDAQQYLDSLKSSTF